MKEDFNLLQYGTTVILDNGVKTKIVEDEILRQDNHFSFDEDDERVRRVFTDEYGDRYVVLDLKKLSPKDIDWSNDSVYVDQSICKVNQHGDVFLSDIDVPQDIRQYDDEALKELRNSITIGSIYLSDYNNELFIDRSELLDICDSFIQWQETMFGKKADDHLGPDDFVKYIREVA